MVGCIEPVGTTQGRPTAVNSTNISDNVRRSFLPLSHPANSNKPTAIDIHSIDPPTCEQATRFPPRTRPPCG